MNALRKSAIPTLVLCLLFFSNTFRYEGAQVFAWASMLVQYESEGNLRSAIQDTFSGERPCAMCLQIAEDQTREAESTPSSPLPEFQEKVPELLSFSRYKLPSLALCPSFFHASLRSFRSTMPAEPPTPPPQIFS